MIFPLVLMLSTAQPVLIADAQPFIDPKLCRMITEYKPGADGSADYVPGVDVQGRPVVEADLDKSPLQMPATTEFDLSIEMAQYLGLAGQKGADGYMPVGHVQINKDGSVLFNGQPMEGQAQANLRAYCSQLPLQKGSGVHYNQ